MRLALLTGIFLVQTVLGNAHFRRDSPHMLVFDDPFVGDFQAEPEKAELVPSFQRRFKRAGLHRTLEDYLQSSHLSWLTDLQKESLRKLSQEGKSKEVILEQVIEYYESTVGDLRKKATTDLQAGCRELYQHLLGAEKIEEFKKMKENGATKEEMKVKANEFIDQIKDPQEKKEAKFYSIGCRKVYGFEEAQKREKRDQTLPSSLDELYKTYLSWLNDEQKTKLTTLKEEGKTRDELEKEVLKYYEEASDSIKEIARQKMQDGCRKVLIKVLGEDKMAELKALRESGTPIKDIAEKTTKWISELTDENAKKSAQEHGTLCRKAFNLQ